MTLDPITIICVSFAVTLLGAAWLASAEVALMGMPESRVRVAIHDGVKGAGHLEPWIAAMPSVLLTLQLLRFTLVVVGAVLGWQLATEYLPHIHPALALGGLATGFVFLTHLLPRVWARRVVERWAIIVVRPAMGLTWLLRPVLWPIEKVFGAVSTTPEGKGSAFWTPDEIVHAANHARAEGLGRSEEDLFRSMIEFSDTVIREIMVPRTEVVTVSVDESAEEIRRIVVNARHSRIPVYEDTMDNVLGLLYVKDLIPTELAGSDAPGETEFDLRRFLRQTFYVPEVMKISELLREFQRRKTHMAIVVDEYGGTAGVVTLEDIIEEIVGEIQDEYDVEDKQFRKIGEKILADGRVNLWDLEESLNVEFPRDAGFETLAGFLVAQTGYVPEAGKIVQWNGVNFTIKEANPKRVVAVEIEPAVEAVVP